MSIVTRIHPISAKARQARHGGPQDGGPQDGGSWWRSSAPQIDPPPVPKWVVYPAALAISLSLWYCLAELVLSLWRLVV
jgi:hypothetical protein